MRPSSANVIAPSIATMPPTTQAAIAPRALPVIEATSRGLKKMPTPMIAPTTTQVASQRLSTCGRAGCEAGDGGPPIGGDSSRSAVAGSALARQHASFEEDRGRQQPGNAKQVA